MGNRCAGTGNPAPDDLALSFPIIRSVPTRLNGLPVSELKFDWCCKIADSCHRVRSRRTHSTPGLPQAASCALLGRMRATGSQAGFAGHQSASRLATRKTSSSVVIPCMAFITPSSNIVRIPS